MRLWLLYEKGSCKHGFAFAAMIRSYRVALNFCGFFHDLQKKVPAKKISSKNFLRKNLLHTVLEIIYKHCLLHVR